MVTFTLPPGLESIMSDMARETGQTAEQIILDAVEERLADFHDLRIAEERLRTPEGPASPLDDVLRRYGLGGTGKPLGKPAAE
jgi:hypothetical protein